MAFAYKDLLDMMDIKIFVETDSDVRLARRLKRDIEERGRSIESVLAQYDKYVKPSFEYYIAPTMAYADIIVPRGLRIKVYASLISSFFHHSKVVIMKSLLILLSSMFIENCISEDAT